MTESVAQAWESFALIAFLSAGVVTALSDRFRSGGRSLPSSFLASILPGLTSLFWPVKIPSLREGDRDFFWPRLASAAFASSHLPYS